MNACTVTIRPRLAYARVLADSFLQHHPGASFSVLVVDGKARADNNHGLVELTPGEIGVSDGELARLALVCTPEELKSALVPRLLGRLIASEGASVLYFSDDTRIYAGLDDLEHLAKESGILLARRTAEPLPADGADPDATALAEKGIFDEGFVGVGPDAGALLEWWSATTGLQARVQASTNLPPGRLLEMMPAYFPAHVLEDRGVAASFWNLWERRVEQRGDGCTVGGVPLRSVHFDGFDPARPHLLGPQGKKPRLLLSERADLAEVTRRYAAELELRGLSRSSAEPYGFKEVAPGVPADDRIRSVYKKALKSAFRGLSEQPPRPFDRGNPQGFVAWLNTPDPSSRVPLVSRYLSELYDERVDLHFAFPGVAGAGAAGFLEWVVRYGEAEADIPASLVEPAARAIEDSSGRPTEPAEGKRPLFMDLPDGINIAGYFTAELGVGEMARLLLLAFQRTPYSFSTYSYRGGFSRRRHPFRQIGEEFAYNTNLICINADQLGQFVMDTGHRVMQHRYNIGFWWWEVDILPPGMGRAADLLDEIWVGTEHVAEAVRSVTDKPVHVIPPPMRPISAGTAERESLGLPAGFTFLFTFDFLSVEERKNPVGVIEAFKIAFPEASDRGPHLVIKSINGDRPSLERLKMSAAGRPDIKILDGYLPPERQDALLACCDCYVSLHRSEGYGIGMAEAMALGRPIIATGYSGNMAFLNDSNSYLAGYRLVSVPSGSGPYPEGARWAEPDLEDAARLMRRVWEHPDEAAALGRQAQREALTIHTPERTAEQITGRMDPIIRRHQLLRREEEMRQPAKVTRISSLRRGLSGFIKGGG